LDALPEALSYSSLTLPGPNNGHTLVRRDLFDARFQLLTAQGNDSKRDSDEQTAAAASFEFVDAPADLVPGAYEGGLKTWECALDLAAYLDRDVLGAAAGRRVRGQRVLELGCGTAVPTLLLLDRLFAHLASEPKATAETDIHLQDYNRSVLELVTLPNILLAWCPSVLLAHSIPISHEASPMNKIDIPGGLTVTRALLAAFTASLDAHKVRLRFFAGGWSSLSERRGQGTPPAPPPYDIVLASETIYRPDALGAFLSVLRTAAVVAPSCCHDDQEVVRPPPPPLCLVAAKVVYFGVGGGVQGFVRGVEEENGTVRTVWEHREGVGRVIMRVEW
ncbi:hypothetical protein BJV74DRAFT_773312, partial [Russula compacta]